MVAVFTWEDFNGITGPGYHSMMSEELLVPPPLAVTDVRYVGDPVAIVDRRDPLPRRGRVRADRGRLRPADSGRRLHEAPPPTPRTSCTRAGASSRTRWCRCRSRRSPPTSTRCSRPPRTSSSATSSRTATWRCRWRRAASWRRSTRAARSSTSRARRSRCTRPRTSSPATCRSPRATCT